MDIVATLTSPDVLMAALAAVSAGAIVFTFGSQFFERSDMKERVKRVALERERLRAAEMARLRGDADKENRGSIRNKSQAGSFVTQTVERFSLQKAFVDDNTKNQLMQAGYRGQGPLTTYLFLRLAVPVGIFLIALLYLAVLAPGGRPAFVSLLYALMAGLVGAYVPVLLLKNKVQKRQASVTRAWPDALDLMLLCVESGMSLENAFRKTSKEMGLQSPELAEELAMTTAELSFLEDRSRAYMNLGERTGLDGVKSVMTALVQSERYGTSVGQSLRIMAEEGREMRLNEAEKKAAALPPKLTVPLILFFLPVLFIVIMAPAMIKIFGMNVNLHL